MKEDKKIPRGQTPERRAYMKQYNANYKRDRSAYKRAYDEANSDKIRKYLDDNKEKIRARRREHYLKNKERLLAKQKRLYSENRDRIIAYQKIYNEQNKEKIRERERAYAKANREIIAYCASLRRSRKFNNGGSHTLEQRKEKFSALGNICFYCGEDKPLTVDHAVPISRGGTDDIQNILPACQSCNSKKRNLTTEEYFEKTNNSNQIDRFNNL